MMRILIESTDELTEIDGVPVRYWQGTTEDGVPCKVFVHLIAVHEADAREFLAKLKEQRPPGRFIDLRMILD